jgi:Carboxypeptidase regulatory-like domain
MLHAERFCVSSLWRVSCVLALCWVAGPLCGLAVQEGSSRKEAALPESPQPQVSTTSGVLRGTVSDPSGAKITHAKVHVQSTSLQRDITTDKTGSFSLPLSPGIYDVTIVAPGFTTYSTNVTLTDRAAHASIDARLVIATQKQQVTVSSENAATDASNQGALILKGSDLDALSDDDTVFQQEIESLAGGDPSQIPEIVVDGFTNAPFPPKNTIAEIRIPQNGFLAEYDSPGYQRVEIFTKPGTGKLHGDFASSGTDNVFDSQNPYFNGPNSTVATEPPYYELNLRGNLSGPINKKTSFFVSGVYYDLQNNAIVNATDPTLLTPLSEAVPAPQYTQTYSARIDRQMTATNLFIGRYEYNRISVNNSGVGLLVLPSEGLNTTTTTQTLQLRDIQPFGSKVVSEAHFQYIRTREQQSPASTGATVIAEGAFNGGGDPVQNLIDKQDNYEFQEILTVDHGSHLMTFGGRYRLQRDSNYSRAGYNGQFLFPSLTAYQITKEGLANNESDNTIRTTCVPNPTGQGTICGGATQYNLTAGDPSAVVLTGDLGVFAQDQWQVRKSLMLYYGFRFESQSAVPDHFDPAPRAAFAWTIGRDVKKPILTLHADSGVFYDRFPYTDILTAIRQQSGTRQPSYILENPNSDFYKNNLITPVPVTSLGSAQPTLYNIDPHMRTEYSILSDIWVDRSFGKFGSIEVYYNYERGDHQYLSRNINAPLPGTYDPSNPASGVRPLGGTQNIYQFGSPGIKKITHWWIQAGVRPTKWIRIGTGIYLAPSQKSDAINPSAVLQLGSSATSFPSNQYDPSADFARLPQPRDRFSLTGVLQLPFGFTYNPLLLLRSHVPFNITTGTDNNGDTIYNDRPAFATNPTANSVIYKTRFGIFDANPQPGEKIIPFDYGDGPRSVFLLDSLNSKKFKFGPRPAPPPNGPATKPDRPYSFSFFIDAQNVFNHVNPGPPVGVLSSPYFGQSIALSPLFGNGVINSANRRIYFGTDVSF